MHPWSRCVDQTWAGQRARAVAVVIINTDRGITRMDVPPEHNVASLRIPTVMVGSDFLAAMPTSSSAPQMFGRFVLAP